MTSDSVVDGVSPQKSFYEAARCSYELLCKCTRSAHRVLGSASLVWLGWLSPQGIMIGCKPHRHPDQTTTGSVCVCVFDLQSVYLVQSLEHSTGGLNLSESGVVDTHTHFLAPWSSMLGTSSTQRAHKHTADTSRLRHRALCMCVCVCVSCPS